MPLLSGTHYCIKCGKGLFWEYSLPERWNNVNAFQFTKGSLHPVLLNNRQSKILEFNLMCTKCNHINNFTYDNRIYHNATKSHQTHF